MNNQSFAEDFFLEIEHLIGEGKKYTSISKTIEMMWDLLDVPSQENIECCDQIFLTATNKSLPQGILIALITQSSHLRDSFKNRETLFKLTMDNAVKLHGKEGVEKSLYNQLK